MTADSTPLHVIRAACDGTQGWYSDIALDDSTYGVWNGKRRICLTDETMQGANDAGLIANAPTWLTELLGRCERAEEALRWFADERHYRGPAGYPSDETRRRDNEAIEACVERARRVLGGGSDG